MLFGSLSRCGGWAHGDGHHCYMFTFYNLREKVEEAGFDIMDEYAYTKGVEHRLLRTWGGGIFMKARKT